MTPRLFYNDDALSKPVIATPPIVVNPPTAK